MPEIKFFVLGLFLVRVLAGCSAESVEDAGQQHPDKTMGDAGPGDGPLDGPSERPAPADAQETIMPGVFSYEAMGRRLELTLLDEAVVRVHYIPDEGAAPERGWTSVITSWPDAPLPFADAGDYLYLRTARLEIRIYKSDARTAFHDRDGTIISSDLPLSASGYSRYLRKTIHPEERFYGFGEKTGPLNKRGYRLQMWNNDPLAQEKYTTSIDPLYQSIPFLMGLHQGRAYGLYLHSTFRTTFDVGYSLADQLLLETEGGDLDYFFIYGPQLTQVVEGFTGITGRMPLPPRWTLGYHQSRWSYFPEAEVRAVTAEFRSRGIPCDGFWLDIDYMDGFRSFTWDASRFPDPPQLLADLEQSGFKVTVIIDPGIKHEPGGSYAVFNEGLAGSHFVTLPDSQVYVGEVWPGKAVFPDFTRAATRDWWAGWVKKLAAGGVRGVWIDMNEPTTWSADGFPLDARFDGEGSPTDLRETHNVYALLMARATFDGLAQARPDRRPFVLTRAGFAGIQRFSAVWTGDVDSSWEHLAMAPTMLMNLGLSGVAFIGSDVGGFSGGPSPELYARWIQLGAFSPFFRSHVQKDTPRQEPWSFGPEVEAINRAHIELRYRLLPYLYSLMREASTRGLPVLRPLVLEYQDDPQTHNLGDQFLFGSSLLVAPVARAEQRARQVYLPQGAWFDYWSDTTYAGQQMISVDAPLERIPLFARAGAIIPSGPLMQYVGQLPGTVLYLDLYPALGSPDSSFTLYEDDGQSRDYETGSYQETRFSLSTSSSGATLTMEAVQGSYVSPASTLRVRWHGVQAPPSSVTLDGTALPPRATLQQLENQEGWFYQAEKDLVVARVPFSRAGAMLVCHYDATIPFARPVQVQLTVSLPAGTPDEELFLTADRFGWSPAAIPLERTGPDQATLLLSLPANATMLYKFTRGSWSTVERTADCKELANRQLTVTASSSGTQQVAVTIARWADVPCP